MPSECPVCGEKLTEKVSSSSVQQAELATFERGAIARASAEFRAAREQGRKERLYRSHFRRRLDAIDECLSRLEDLHLAGLPIAQLGGRKAVVEALAAQAGEEPPAAVRTARNSYALHDALLDWESAVLDAVVPGRRERFPDLDRDSDGLPRMRRRRRNGRGNLKAVAG
jgi:hypothetical protein